MRPYLQLLLLFIIPAFLYSCGSSSEVTQVTERARTLPAPSQDEVTQPSVSDPVMLRIGENEPLRSMDPLFAYNDASKRFISLVYDRLTNLDASGNAVPSLAEEWSVSEDSLTYIFTLRDDVFFHDDRAFSSGLGRALNANDVAFSFGRMAIYDVPDDAALLFQTLIKGFEAFRIQERTVFFEQDVTYANISGIEVLDDRRVQFRLNRPSAEFTRILASPLASIYPAEVFEHRTTGLHNNPVGTGRFVFNSNSADSLVILERNFNYFDASFADERITSLEFRYFNRESRLFSAFSLGEIDIIPQIGPQTAKTAIMLDPENNQLILNPGYEQQFILKPSGVSQAGVFGIPDNLANFPLSKIRELILNLQKDEFLGEIPLNLRITVYPEDNNTLSYNTNFIRHSSFELRQGAAPTAYNRYLAGLAGTLINDLENYTTEVRFMPRAHRDFEIYYDVAAQNGVFSGTNQLANAQKILGIEILHFALVKESLDDVLFSSTAPWWMSFRQLDLADTPEL
ncbi:MAG: ABC transporter substrate-binding protein [Balneolales bacterium]|nr:ABC transporter substrate-binding protein [Balneolales bacterium]